MKGDEGKHLFVTVGTTKFDELIDTISSDEVLHKLAVENGFTSVQFQTGVGKYEKRSFPGLKLSYETYFDNFKEEIRKADLVISHAGAGTCLDVLKLEKPLIVVINEKLMDNHQIELAEELQKNGYLIYGTCNELINILDKKEKKNWEECKKYPKADKSVFGNYLNKCMGFCNN